MARTRMRFVQLEDSSFAPDPIATSEGAALVALSELTEPIRPLFKLAPLPVRQERDVPLPAPPWLDQLRALSASDVELRDADLEFERHLGEGAFATVELHSLKADIGEPRSRQLWEAFPTGRVALKRSKGPAGAAQLELAIRTEGALLRMVPHHNIVTSVGCTYIAPLPRAAGGSGRSAAGGSGGGGEALVLVEEFLSGGSLRDQLRSGRYSAAQALNWIIDVAAALAALHGAAVPVAHRDLKPDNVLLDQSGAAKLVDFGLARLMARPLEPAPAALAAESARTDGADGADGPAACVSLAHISVRTPEPRAEDRAYTQQTGSERYMAPENYAGRRYDQRVDTFSFAVVAYELLSRSRAYEGLHLTSEQIAGAVAAKGLRPALPARWPGGVRGLLSRCWAHDACERPAMGEVLSELGAFRDAHGDAELEALFGRQGGFDLPQLLLPMCPQGCTLA